MTDWKEFDLWVVADYREAIRFPEDKGAAAAAEVSGILKKRFTSPTVAIRAIPHPAVLNRSILEVYDSAAPEMEESYLAYFPRGRKPKSGRQNVTGSERS